MAGFGLHWVHQKVGVTAKLVEDRTRAEVLWNMPHYLYTGGYNYVACSKGVVYSIHIHIPSSRPLVFPSHTFFTLFYLLDRLVVVVVVVVVVIDITFWQL
jgi:hypothetical protein